MLIHHKRTIMTSITLTLCLLTLTSSWIYPAAALPTTSDPHTPLLCPEYCDCVPHNLNPLNIVVRCICSNCETIPSPLPKHTKELDISGFPLGQISRVTFAPRSTEFEELEVLSMAQCEITHLSPDAFENTQNLKTLNLQNNSISALTKSTFKELLKLEHIDLSYNNLDCELETAMLTSIVPSVLVVCKDNVKISTDDSEKPSASTDNNYSDEKDSDEMLDGSDSDESEVTELPAKTAISVDAVNLTGSESAGKQREGNVREFVKELDKATGGIKIDSTGFLNENSKSISRKSDDITAMRQMEVTDMDDIVDSTNNPLESETLSVGITNDFSNVDSDKSDPIKAPLTEFDENKKTMIVDATEQPDNNDSQITAAVVGGIITAIRNGVRALGDGQMEDEDNDHVEKADEVLTSDVGPTYVQIGIFVLSIALLIASAIMMYFIHKISTSTDSEDEALVVPLSKIPYVLVATEDRKLCSEKKA